MPCKQYCTPWPIRDGLQSHFIVQVCLSVGVDSLLSFHRTAVGLCKNLETLTFFVCVASRWCLQVNTRSRENSKTYIFPLVLVNDNSKFIMHILLGCQEGVMHQTLHSFHYLMLIYTGVADWHH